MDIRGGIETRILETYGMISEYETIIRLTRDPRERMRSQRELDSLWSLLDQDLADYHRLVQTLPDDIAQIATRAQNRHNPVQPPLTESSSQEPPSQGGRTVHAQTYIEGGVHIQGGDYVAGDKTVVQNSQVGVVGDHANIQGSPYFHGVQPDLSTIPLHSAQGPAKLSGAQYEHLHKALLGAYDFASLKRMLYFKLSKSLDHIAPQGASFDDVVFELIALAEQEGWTADLVRAAGDDRPNKQEIQTVVRQYWGGAASIPADSPPTSALEAELDKVRGFMDAALFIERAPQIQRAICGILIDGGHIGTGFLIAPDVVLTCYHVVKDVIARDYTPGQVSIQFDLKRPEEGGTSRTYRLATEWLLDHRPNSPIDTNKALKGQNPNPDHLDYALLRVAGSPGNTPRPGAPDQVRGWLSLPAEKPPFKTGTQLIIFQHPGGLPLKLDIDAIKGLNGNGTRVMYTTNTRPGSSGSPCFDAQMRLVALHQGREPVQQPTYNQGIPIYLIRQKVVAGGLGGMVGIE